eukprot:3514369-Amphidinium_carterae.1
MRSNPNKALKDVLNKGQQTQQHGTISNSPGDIKGTASDRTWWCDEGLLVMRSGIDSVSVARLLRHDLSDPSEP